VLEIASSFEGRRFESCQEPLHHFSLVSVNNKLDLSEDGTPVVQ
jgi:hypothetical protein